MVIKSNIRTYLLAVLLSLICNGAAFGQVFTFDARKVALGGAGGDVDNIAAKMIDEQRVYGAIVVPLGLVQLVRDWKYLKPGADSKNFDPVRLFEYAAGPLHFVPNRGSDGVGTPFITDLLNGSLTSDISNYYGFEMAENVSAEGLIAPTWGKTIPVVRRGSAFHAVYVGAGPYLAVGTTLHVDTHLREALAGGLPIPDATLRMDNVSDGQLAMAITGGYRGRFTLPVGGSSERNGLYVAANYHHLRGLQYFGVDSRFRFDTNSLGFVVDPDAQSVSVISPENPIVVNRFLSGSGSGLAIDVGVGAVVDRWEVGFGATGIGNRINWRNLEQTRFTMSSVLNSGEFVDQEIPLSDSTLRTQLPVSLSGNVAYHHDRWSAMGVILRGFNGTTMRLGYERRLRTMEVRGGGRYSRGTWHPSGGVGFSLSPRVGLDLAAFTTTANIQQKQKLAFAASFRLNPR